MSDAASPRTHLEPLLKPLRRYLARLTRKVRALEGDLAEAEGAPEVRRRAEALLAYLGQVRRGASRVALPDPGNPGRTLEVELDPRYSAQANAARLFKRAAKLERGAATIAGHLERTRRDLQGLASVLDRAAASTGPDALLRSDLDRWLAGLPWELRPRDAAARRAAPGEAATPSPAPRRRDIPARLVPRRLATSEGWHVLVGRSNEGNDYLTHTLARPEDYWFHVHGAAGSHVVLRRGKGKDEPSKATLEEVAGWAAFYSQARTAGKVPVIVARKKHVRRARKGPPGLALCTHQKTLIVRPREPRKQAREDPAPPGP